MTRVHGPAGDNPTDPRRRAVGQRLRDIREQAGLTQEAVAREANLHRVFYGRVESGTANVSLSNLFNIVDALQIDIGDLFANL